MPETYVTCTVLRGWLSDLQRHSKDSHKYIIQFNYITHKKLHAASSVIYTYISVYNLQTKIFL